MTTSPIEGYEEDLSSYSVYGYPVSARHSQSPDYEMGMSMQQLATTEPAAPTRAPESAPAFLVHNEGDSVAVAVQDVEPGAREAVYMDSDRAITVNASEAIPLGHKVALVDLAEEADIIEYGVRVGVTRRAISAGELVHTHNIRSARWTNSR